jgi:putative ABC transport system ATP-binding protein
MPDPCLGFEGVAVTAPDGTELLHGIDLEMWPGRLTVVVGASGSGKSTLLRLANRLEVPSVGRVVLEGTDVASMDPLVLRRRVGMVFQRPTPFPGSVADNLRVALPAADDATLSEALDRVGLGAAFLDRAADDLSGGEAQRMCLARTLLTEPRVVLMDEATSALDPAARTSVEALARQLVDEGLTVVWVTHDLAQARRLAGDVVVLVDGRLAGPAEARAYLAQDAVVEADEPGGADDGAPTDGPESTPDDGRDPGAAA